MSEEDLESKCPLYPIEGGCTSVNSLKSAWKVPHIEGRQTALDGLRGIAMVLVLMDHVGIREARFVGFLGVSIFFVLSGFLISGIIIKDLESQNLNKTFRYNYLKWFYSARAARLMPAQLTMLAICWFALPRIRPKAYTFDHMQKASLRALTSTEDQFGRTPYTHTWSLAVEEWSYLFLSLSFPWLPTSLKGRTKSLLILTTFFWLLKIFFTFSSSGQGLPWYGDRYFGIPPLNFGWHYGTFPNMAKILLGSCIRLCPMPRFLLKKHRILSVTTTILLLICAYPLDRHLSLSMKSQNVQALLSDSIVSILTSIVILTSLKGNHLLELPIFRFLGRISYSLYLWHFPLIAAGSWGSKMERLGWVLISTVISYISTTVVEEPVLRWFRKLRTSLKGL